MKKHYERVISVCCFLFLFVNIGFPSTSFSVYQPYIVELVGDSGGAMVLSVRTFTTLITMLFINVFYERLDCRICVTAATVLTALGFTLYSFANTLPLFLVGSLATGFAYSLGGLVGMTLLTGRWYHKHASTAIGFATVGSGFASVVMPPIVTSVVHAASLTAAFRVSAAIALVVGILVCALVRNQPSDLGMLPYGAEPGDDSEHVAAGEHPGVKLSRGRYALLYLAMTAIGGVSVGAMVYLAVLMTSNGFSLHFAALMLSVAGLALTFSKFLTGVLFDKVGTTRGTFIIYAFAIAGLLLCCLVPLGSAALAVAAAAVLGIGVVVGSVGVSVWALEFSTSENRVRVTKNFQVAYAVGSFLSSTFPGILKDVLGTYEVSYVILLVALIVSAVLVCGTCLHVRRLAG